jgi:acetaldehyde dehydrogenase (acetylating)
MAIDKDLTSMQQARDLLVAAHTAQQIFATFSQQQVDTIVAATAQAALAAKDRLAEMAVSETGYGVVKDKADKNRFAAADIPRFFRDVQTVGVLKETPQMMEIATPRGIVAAIIPSTNPTSTAIFKILISLKARNGVVLSPHPSATQCINETARIMKAAAEAAGAPSGLIGCLSVATLSGTEELMKHKLTAVILATGGIGLVRAAYSSGKPAFGVGPGNVPVLIERSANITKAVADILAGKTFDYGTICASEQAIVVERTVEVATRQALIAQGAYFCNATETKQLAQLMVLPSRGLNPQVVGKAPQVIAEMAGFRVAANVRALVVELQGVGRDHPLSLEKLSPVLAYYVVDNWEVGSDLCEQVLRYGGMGHTIGIHSQNRDIIRQFGLRQPAARIIVNSPTTHGAIGLSTDLSPSMTLGCGSWGGNVTSDNISPLHLLDIKRVAFETRAINKLPAPTLINSSVNTNPAVNLALISEIATAVVAQLRGNSPASNSAPPADNTAANTKVTNSVANSPTTAASGAATPASASSSAVSTATTTANDPLSDTTIATIMSQFLASRAATTAATPAKSIAAPSNTMAKVHDLHAPRANTAAASSAAAIAPTADSVASSVRPVTTAPPLAATPVSTSTASEAAAAQPVNSPAATVATATTEKPAGTSPRPAATDFVCEADVRRALYTQQKIYVNEKTIITPAAREVGDSNAIFASV